MFARCHGVNCKTIERKYNSPLPVNVPVLWLVREGRGKEQGNDLRGKTSPLVMADARATTVCVLPVAAASNSVSLRYRLLHFASCVYLSICCHFLHLPLTLSARYCAVVLLRRCRRWLFVISSFI
jgi:hypothetical protein